MVAQRVLGWLLTRHGESFVKYYYDMSNAFRSTKQEVLIEDHKKIVENEDQGYTEQRILYSTLENQVVDGEITMMPSDVTLWGSSEGPKFFINTLVDEITEENIEGLHDPSLGNFADNVVKTTFIVSGMDDDLIECAIKKALAVISQ